MTPPLATASEPLSAVMRSFEFTATEIPAAVGRRAPPPVRDSRALRSPKGKNQNRK